MKVKHHKELDSVEESFKDTIELINTEKEKITGTLHDAVEREHKKMEQMHAGDLEQKEKMFESNLQSLKV